MRKFFTFFAIAAVVLGMVSCEGNDPEQTIPGALKGKFSVAAGKQVYFSIGNLQYNAYRDKWRFAEEQWDYVGDNTNGTVYNGTTKCSNLSISPDYNGWIDLFGFGTGLNPTLSSTHNYDYTKTNDWGRNAIYNGGNKVDMWRTLTGAEWQYLLTERNRAFELMGFGSVKGINGLFILPDNWQLPEGLTFVSAKDINLAWNESTEQYNTAEGKHFSHNTYSINDWLTMEKAGAAFLPAGGLRSGTTLLQFPNMGGYYWASTFYTETSKANYIGFGSTLMNCSYQYDPSRTFPQYGMAVRLVQDVR